MQRWQRYALLSLVIACLLPLFPVATNTARRVHHGMLHVHGVRGTTATSGDVPSDDPNDNNAEHHEEAEPAEASATAMARTDDPCKYCAKMHRGILHRVMDPNDFSKNCFVYGVLYCNLFELYRGKELVNQFDVNAIMTPILLTSGSHLCFTVKMAGNTNPEILCAENINCRNEWWKALTRQVLCMHHGTELRHEIAGEPVIEEEERLVAEKVIEKPEAGGVNVKLSGITDMPVVKLRRITPSTTT